MKIKYRGVVYNNFIIKYIGGLIYSVIIIRGFKGDIHTSPEKIEIIK